MGKEIIREKQQCHIQFLLKNLMERDRLRDNLMAYLSRYGLFYPRRFLTGRGMGKKICILHGA
jgi:hypothetical protein